MDTQRSVHGSGAILEQQTQNYFDVGIPTGYNRHEFPIQYSGSDRRLTLKGLFTMVSKDTRTRPRETRKGNREGEAPTSGLAS